MIIKYHINNIINFSHLYKSRLLHDNFYDCTPFKFISFGTRILNERKIPTLINKFYRNIMCRLTSSHLGKGFSMGVKIRILLFSQINKFYRDSRNRMLNQIILSSRFYVNVKFSRIIFPTLHYDVTMNFIKA